MNMKTVVDYLKEHGKYEHDFDGRAFELELNDIDDQILLGCNGDWVIISAKQKGWTIENDIREILEDNYGIQIRFCEECGKPFDAGFIAGDGDWYCCEECFDVAMDQTYGKGQWRPSEYEGEWGGWYEHLKGNKWEDTAIFYTEWY
jgi:hypothetical protein